MRYFQHLFLTTLSKVIFTGSLLLGCSQHVLADAVDDFIQTTHTATYDCPDDKFIPSLENYLKDPNISAKQRTQLKVHKAHWLICIGKYEQAQEMLQALLTDPELDKASQSYASIHYQIGFIYDVQDNPQRCDFYRQSEQLAKDKFKDIQLSSRLGLITVCGQEQQSIGVKLGQLFSLLVYYSSPKDQQALAHIHNNIGLLYSSIGQMDLAAEQYEKSYELGLNVYEEKNQLAPLISVITAYSGSGDYDKAKLMIDELGKRNLKVNTPLSNSWYHFALTRHSVRTGDYETLRKSLRNWEVFLKQISSQTMQKLHEWYTAVLCLHDQDKVCVEDFLARQNNDNLAMPNRLAKHIYFKAFIVRAHLFLGNSEAAKQSFEHYTEVVQEKVKNQQSSGRILGVANLHNEILGLESSLAKAQKQRLQIIILAVSIIISLLVVVYLIWGRPYLRKLETDSLTGLLNEHSVLTQIKKVASPVTGKINTLALFEVNNLNAVIDEFGYQTGQKTLQHASDCLKHVTREKDIIGRIGTAQFVVCLKSIEELTANELFGRMQSALNKVSFKLSCGDKVEISASMHIYSSASSLSDGDQVLAEIRHVLAKA